jgi:hypothetical protein
MNTTTTTTIIDLTTEQAIEAIRDGKIVTAPYHVAGYGPAKIYHAWGQAILGEASGPEGYLRLGVSAEGALIIDECEDWCPQGMQSRPTAASGGHYIALE